MPKLEQIAATQFRSHPDGSIYVAVYNADTEYEVLVSNLTTYENTIVCFPRREYAVNAFRLIESDCLLQKPWQKIFDACRQCRAAS